MSKPSKRRFRLSVVREGAAKRRGSTIEIETDDGQVFSMPAPGFWDDPIAELMGKGKEVELATALLGGPDEYARFRASGGRAQDIALTIAAFSEDQGVNEGESSASSSS
ncbi:hypothetical protein AB0I61_17365 [Polymorphospora rubra]|uniref:hypothetical protein n=1 Tax=Polymorphospora rubra TaxID=338584 RepID=UPI0033F6E0D5